MREQGVLRPWKAAELSDGTLRYLLLVAALLSPRPQTLMILNEPETSLHPDLLPPLGRLIAQAAQRARGLACRTARVRSRARSASATDRAGEATGRDARATRRATVVDLADAIEIGRASCRE